MKRRNFIASLGLSAPAMLSGERPGDDRTSYSYPKWEKLEDAVDDLGRLAIYLKLSGTYAQVEDMRARTQVQAGREAERKTFYFATGERGYASLTEASIPVEVVCVLCLTDFTEDTLITIGDWSFPLGQLLKQLEWVGESTTGTATAFLLGHHEIGEIDAQDFLGARELPNRDFTFAIMADPQGGDPGLDRYKGSQARIQVHNAFIQETIERLNELEERPLFTLVLGDYTDHQGEEAHFLTMDRLFRELNTPVLLEIGNHETRYAADFTPGYRMDAFDNYFAAQKRINGLDKLLYSFNLGAFHFIVWPDPLRSGFWETHPHYFDWLERDLEKYREVPTIFFQHVPLHPIGIDPLVHYAEKPYVRQYLLDLLARHGNVKYVFSGHVHIPLKASVKTAVTYRGIRFINLPAAGYRPRAFGEEDYFGGPVQGAAVVRLNDEDMRVDYLDVTRNRFTYPTDFPEVNLGADSLLTLNKWELAGGTEIRNGSFADRAYWYGNYVYQEDESPTYLRQLPRRDGQSMLHLRADKRKYDKPGQDRLPQTLNQLTQVVFAPEGRFAEIELQLQVDCGRLFERALVGAFVWIEGYWGHHKRYSLIYSAGHIPESLSNRFNRSAETVIVHRHLPALPGTWHTVVLNPQADLGNDLRQPIDRWALNLGVWNINDGNNDGIGAYFTAIEQRSPGKRASQLDGITLPAKPSHLRYALRVDHLAGEHVIASQEELYFF
jgi:hypothetical protein